jgi:hypothetical protein
MPTWDRVRQELGGISREAGRRVLDERYEAGYNDAASICFSILEGRIEGLYEKIQSDGPLSDAEQLLLASLDGVKKETDAALRESIEDVQGT